MQLPDHSFNPMPPAVMHVDINSCFATIEQQANPSLRGKPVVVAAYAENHGCILTASVEAKRLGVETGMRVGDARQFVRNLIVLPPDPDKYRFVNRQLLAILSRYSASVCVESIDEMVMDLKGSPSCPLDGTIRTDDEVIAVMTGIGRDIKAAIRREIGEWMTVSIGIAPNKYLAKISSGFHKPDGMDSITRSSIEMALSKMRLVDLCGIKEGNANRLRSAGITTPNALYRASPDMLKKAFRSIVGYYWWRRLHGWEDGMMYKEFGAPEEDQKSFGQSYAFAKQYTPDDPHLWQIMTQLVMKMGTRLRADGYTARGVGVSVQYREAGYWHTQEMYPMPLFSDTDFTIRLRAQLSKAPLHAVRILAVYCYRLGKNLYAQQQLFETDRKKEYLTQAIDAVTARWGNFTVTPARMLSMEHRVMDRIAFGKGGIRKTV